MAEVGKPGEKFPEGLDLLGGRTRTAQVECQYPASRSM